ncbi:hypothetical protein [Streptomyces sp. NPDC002788]
MPATPFRAAVLADGFCSTRIEAGTDGFRLRPAELFGALAT